MKKTPLAIFSAVLLLSTFILSPVFAKSFDDVEYDDENYVAVEYLVNIGTLEGYPDGSFQPDKTVNRAELMKILVAGQGIAPDESVYKDCYPDVTDDWYAKYVCYATEQDWVSGYPDGTFKPADTVNKVEAVKMLINALGLSDELPDSVSEEIFSDTDSDEWYAPYLWVADEHGLLEEDGVFGPSDGMERGGIAENIFRTLVVTEGSVDIYTEEDGDDFLDDEGYGDIISELDEAECGTSDDSDDDGGDADMVVFEEEGLVLDDDAIVNVEVIQLEDGSYRMYYHTFDEILSAISEDGENFELEDEVLLDGQMSSTVQLSDGSYRMYYSDDDRNLASATSEDGYNFTKESGLRLETGDAGDLDSEGILHPSVVVLSDGSYKIYYDGSSKSGADAPDDWTIMSADSEDGLTWTKDDGARLDMEEEDDEDGEDGCDDDEEFDLDYASSAHVNYEDGEYTMYFMAEAESKEYSGIWQATSTDGLTFEVQGDSPVIGSDDTYLEGVDSDLSGGPAGLPQDPFILKMEDGERMFYWKNEEGIFSAFRAY